MNFTNIAKYWKEDVVASEASAQAAERAVAGGEKQINKTANAREKQKAQMASQKTTPVKSDVSYASEDLRIQREYQKMLTNSQVDWRSELIEAAEPEEGPHPYVDVMPFVNQKTMDAKRQKKGAAKMEAGKQQVNAMQEDMSIKDQMAVSREAAKTRNPNPDHRAIRGKRLKSIPTSRDSRSDAEKMADAYASPRKGPLGATKAD